MTRSPLPTAFAPAERAARAGLTLLSRARAPQTSGTLALPGLREPVEVIRDRWGVPYLYAANLHDLMLAQGFVHAQDRLWQMEFNRRVSAGRLSEVLGATTLKVDRWMRALTLRRVAEREVPLLDGETRAHLEAYAAGVNACIARGRLPVEFILLRYKPEPWQVADSLAWIKMMSLSLSVNWQTELMRAQLIARLGPERAADLERAHPGGQPVIVRPELGCARVAGSILDRAAEAEPFTGPLAHSGLGSNNWVVSGARTTTGKPILANDMHLSLTIPAIWYENHLCGGGLHVTGISFPGIPGIVTGHNERVAWGFTNGYPDVQDLYIERLRRTDDGHVQAEYDGVWQDADVLHETIGVKGGQTVVEEVIVTRHGPVISSAIPDVPNEPPLALRWTSLEPDTLIAGIFRMMAARDCAEFRQALRDWTAPVQNVVYADVDGNIAYSFPGKVPMRTKGDGCVPAPGWTSEYEWRGYIPFDELPHLLNPPHGYIATANNRVAGDDYPYDLGRETATGDRARRIIELIESRDRLDVDFVRQMHFDQVSHPARAIASRLAGLQTNDPELATIIERIGAWDGRLAADSMPAAVQQVFIRALVKSMLANKLGDSVEMAGLIQRLVGVDRIWYWALSVLDECDAFWLDLGHGETRDDVMRLALRQTVDDLKAVMGADVADWSLGKLHRLTYHHPLGEVKVLAPFFNRGPFALGGDGTTVWAASSESGDPQADKIIGPPYRMIVDLGDWGRSISLLSPGQSGHPGSAHYDDQVMAWFDGEYHPMLFAREDVEKHAQTRLMLEPR